MRRRRWGGRITAAVVVAAAAMALPLAGSAAAAPLLVVTTDDAGVGSLRNAITVANATPGPDTIGFAIPGDGPHTIHLLSALPNITDPVVIDGTTQPGFTSCQAGLVIELDGSAVAVGSGLSITAGSTTVRGLAINRFVGPSPAAGIRLVSNGNNVLQCNFLGTDPTGTVAAGNERGVDVDPFLSGNVIGGTSPAHRNVISGNSMGLAIAGGSSAGGTSVQGNYIGTDRTGTAAVPNSSGIMSDAPALIGGAADGAGNLISGNSFVGVHLAGASGAVVAGNLIGTDVSGTTSLVNRIAVEVVAPGHAIGTPGAGNVIAGPVIVRADADDTVIRSNLIGTTTAGNAVLPAAVRVEGASDVAIGGTGTGDGNVIVGGLSISGSTATGNVIRGNRIGTDVSGTAALGDGSGITVTAGASGTVVGGPGAGAGNQISGNITGLTIAGAVGTVVQGNLIGTGPSGDTALPNSAAGIEIHTGSDTQIGGTGVGEGNVIAFNGSPFSFIGGPGVFVGGTGGHTISGNSIHDNVGLGIDLSSAFAGCSGRVCVSPQPDGVTPNDAGDADVGPNGVQNFPVVTSASIAGGALAVSGTLHSTPSTTFTVELFSSPACDASGHGEGETYLASVSTTTDASGNGSFSATGLDATGAGVVTATATHADGSTSEFSACEPVAAAAIALDVTHTVDDASVAAGDTVAFDIDVTNPSTDDATGVWMVDQIGDGLTVLSVTPSQGTCTTTVGPGGTTVACALGTIAGGGSASVEVSARASRVGEWAATASSGNGDDTADDSEVVDVVVVANAVGCTIVGGPGDDTLVGTDGDDFICGGPGNDTITGGAGNDVVAGQDGNDTLTGQDGNDAVWGGPGVDGMWGWNGNDYMNGGPGADFMRGGPGADQLVGGTDADWLFGDADADVIEGRDGAPGDRLNGGDGVDTCRFDTGDQVSC